MISPIDPALPQATSLIPTLRAIAPGDGVTAQIGGTAAAGHDFLIAQGSRAPYAVGADPDRERGRPVPAVRLALHPAQGGA